MATLPISKRSDTLAKISELDKFKLYYELVEDDSVRPTRQKNVRRKS